MSRLTELLCSSTQSCHRTGQLTSIPINLTWMQEKIPHSPRLPCKRSSCSTTNTLQKDPSKPGWQYHLVGTAEQGSPDPSLFRAARGSGLSPQTQMLHMCRHRAWEESEEADCCRKTNSLCCKCPVPGFLCKPEENPSRSAGLAPA